MARTMFAIGAVSILIVGCGSGAPHTAATASAAASSTTTTTTTSPAQTTPRTPRHTLTIPAPPPTGIPAPKAAVAVIRNWANALRHGDVAAAAAYFSLPSVMINGVGANGQVSVIRIHNAAQARFAQETLPCGARLISTDLRGQYVNALFALTGRRGPGGSDCGSGASGTARTNFVIGKGRILAWIRAPSDPGDNSGPGVASPPPSGSSGNSGSTGNTGPVA